MASFNFVVDTTPMANTVDSVKGHVAGTTAAVVAMEAAVINAEKNASDVICENVDKGFYVLIKSQLSQKSVAAYTEMTAKQMTLFELSKALERIKQQMTSDYNMIAQRYHKLFNSLNKSLETRVKELDKPAMRIADIKKNFLFARYKDSSALLLSAQNEVSHVVETAGAGKLKQKTKSAVRALSENVVQGESYSRKLSGILREGSPSAETGKEPFFYIPVVLCSQESLHAKNEFIDLAWSAKADAYMNVSDAVNALQGGLNWVERGAEEKEKLKSAFLKIAEENVLDERVSGEISRLFNASELLTLQAEGGQNGV